MNIYKYPLKVEDSQTIVLPKDAKILSLQVQREVPCIWVLADFMELQKVAYRFNTYGTGYQVPGVDPASQTFVGSYQLQNGALVFHVFVEDKKDQ